MIKNFILFALLCLSPSFVSAREVPLSESQEILYHKLLKEIKCPVCNGQSIEGSELEAADLLKAKIRFLILSGLDEEQVITEMRELYGDEITFLPPHNEITAILWGFPAFAMLLSLILLFYTMKRRASS